MNKYISAAMVALLSVSFTIYADVDSDIRAAMNEGNYDYALTLAQNELARNPKGATLTKMTMMAGEAAYHAHKTDIAEKYLAEARSKGVADAFLYAGKLALEDFRIGEAREMYNKYFALMQKSRKEPDPTALSDQEAVERYCDMLDHVENIAIIDSISVPKDNFYKDYRLASSAGRLTGSKLPAEDAYGPMYVPEDGSLCIWSQMSDGDYLTLYQSNALLGGGWGEPSMLQNLSEDDCNLAYPYLTQDGLTLYFASDGDESMGGYDIFRANRDSDTGQFRYPVNVGLPYNSPYDDYMLAIDEETGVGWWATDRNRLAGYITVYVFIPNNVRRNYDIDKPGLEQLAAVKNYHATIAGCEAEAAEKLEKIAMLNSVPASSKDADMLFTLPDGTVADISNSEYYQVYKAYRDAESRLQQADNELTEARERYHTSPASVSKQEIYALENKREIAHKEMVNARGSLIVLVKK